MSQPFTESAEPPMTRDPRAKWNHGHTPDEWNSTIECHAWVAGANDRLAALLPQLKAADALADAWFNGGDVGVAHAAYLAARDAHLTEGTSE